MIKKILVFGGTIEGRRMSDYLSEQQIQHTVCVATDYGEEVLEQKEFREIHQGRMNLEQMVLYIQTNGYSCVIDATHPYAVEVSKNIRLACASLQMDYLRYLRPLAGEHEKENYHYVDSTAEAADFLEQQKGNIFLTTGSKELHVFTERITDKSRLFARVLPSVQVIAACRELGLEGKQICGMQGPFSAEINEAMFRQTKSEWMVTKDTGTSGGFPEKIQAAENAGVQVVIVRRPLEDGCSFEEVKEALKKIILEAKEKNCEKKAARVVSCIGIGMGTMETMTHEAAQAIRDAQVVFGAKRILESAEQLIKEKQSFVEYQGNKIAEYLNQHSEIQNAAVLMSGDVGFYSGARGIQTAFPPEEVRYYCGISSVVYFASRIPTAWQDVKLLSAHGKNINLLNYVNRYPKIMMLVSGAKDVEAHCQELVKGGFNEVRVTVGTNLSYPEETISYGIPSDFCTCKTQGLHIMMIENSGADYIVTPGISDETFVRGKVPMTKEEIRVLSLAKLQLREDSVLYDVGAGTGSVSLEAARLCTSGTVYAIERNPEGIELIQENARNLRLSNVVTVEGLAPEAMNELPAPTHGFIGGSSGNMKEIIEALQLKNPSIRIVINTIALESIAEVTMLIKELELNDAEILQISAAKSRVLGKYHMMTAQNPIYIISFGG